MFFVVIIVLAVIFCCEYFQRRTFEEAVSEARKKQRTVNHCLLYSTDENAPPIFEAYEGDFDMKYTDRGKELSGVAKIRLKDKNDPGGGGGYEIEGRSHDADGRSDIAEGFVSYYGDAWWIEVTMSGRDKGLKVLTEGSFDFATHSFTGSWRAHNGLRGQYTEFKGRNVSKLFRPCGNMGSNRIQTLEEMLEEDIPMAVAMVEVETDPLVQAVPATKSAGSGCSIPAIAIAANRTAIAQPTALSPLYQEGVTNGTPQAIFPVINIGTP